MSVVIEVGFEEGAAQGSIFDAFLERLLGALFLHEKIANLRFLWHFD